MKLFTSFKQKTGLRGELAAETFLMKHGFKIIDRNYSTRFGEIDIIAKKDNRIHFCEVKAVTVPSSSAKAMADKREMNNVTHETQNTVSRETFLRENKKLINPFQNVSFFKIKRLVKTAEIYLQMNRVPRETRWQVDGLGVYLEPEKEPRIEYLPNINIQ